MSLSKRLATWGVALSLSVSAGFSQAVPTTQLGFLIDQSGSIVAADFATMRSGIAAAFTALPTDGTVEVTVVKFATGVQTVISPTVVTAGNLAGLIASINAMTQTGGGTDMALGIDSIAGLMLGSGNYSAGLASMINLATDGIPNSLPQTITAATNARNNGIDALTSEGIGAGVNLGNIQDFVFSPLGGPANNFGVVLPLNSAPPNPMTSLPWVVPVNSFDDFGPVLRAKIQSATGQVPEPGTLALLGLAMSGLILVRRRKPLA